MIDLDALLRLAPALWLSVKMAAASVAVGLPLGFSAGLMLASRRRLVRWPVVVLMEVFRGFPALVTLYLVYFGMSGIILIDVFTAVVVAFGLTSAAYSADIFRAAIQSVPRGQREAAAALGIPRIRSVLLVVAPHVARVAMPPLLGIVILVFQGTSLAYAIGAKELLGTAYSYGLNTYALLPELIAASALYLLVTIGLGRIERMAELRASRIGGDPRHSHPTLPVPVA